jgi:hypothetical protein
MGRSAAREADEQLLRRLGLGEPVAALAESLGWSVPEVRAWFARMCASRAALFIRAPGTPVPGIPTERDVRIERDERGLPHVMAEGDADLLYGLGWAMAEDRLFQVRKTPSWPRSWTNFSLQ